MSRNVLIIILQEESHVKHKLVNEKRQCVLVWGESRNTAYRIIVSRIILLIRTMYENVKCQR